MFVCLDYLLFPQNLKHKEQRLNWCELINRRQDNRKLWSPQKQSRVRSIHFIDANPMPTLNSGYASDRNVAKVTKPPSLLSSPPSGFIYVCTT